MSPKQIRLLQIFVILFLSSLTLYVLFKEAEKPIEETLILPVDQPKEKSSTQTSPNKDTSSSQKDYAPSISKEEYAALVPSHKEALKTFELKAADLLERLPRKADLQKLEDHQVHSIPPDLLKMGRELGKLKEMVISYPDFPLLQSKAKDFYKACADDEEHPTSIRSLCLFNRLQLAKNSGEKFDISPYPLEIKQLVLELNPFRN